MIVSQPFYYSPTIAVKNCHERLHMNLQSVSVNSSCVVNEMELIQDPKVFSPQCFSSTAMFANHIPFPQNKKVLEIGTGIGAIALTAAMKHHCDVVATDINPKAVQVAQKNCEKYGQESSIDIRLGKTFDPILAGEKFDLIFWNWPFIYAPSDYKPQYELEQAVIDPGYQEIYNFLFEAKEHLNPNGKIVLTFSSLGNEKAFSQILLLLGAQSIEIHSEKIGPNQYSLLEILL